MGAHWTRLAGGGATGSWPGGPAPNWGVGRRLCRGPIWTMIRLVGCCSASHSGCSTVSVPGLLYIDENFKFSFTELCYYHYFNHVFDTDLANKNPSSGSQALWTCTHPFLRFPFFPGTTECYRFILYFLCPGIKVRHFSKKHGSFLYLEIEIWILGVLIAVAVTTGFRSSVNTAGK